MLAHYGVNVADGYNWTLVELKSNRQRREK